MHEPNGLPSSGSGLLWDFLSLQMLLLIQVGPMSNTITLWPSSIMCREAFIFRSSFGVTLALKKEAEGQDSQWPCFFFLQMCSSPGQESQGSLAVTYYSRPCTRSPTLSLPSLPAALEQPAFPITISKLIMSSFQFSRIPGLLCPACSRGSISSPKWKPGVQEQQPCVFASAHPDPQDFLEALQDCTSRHNENFVPREHCLETFSLLF